MSINIDMNRELEYQGSDIVAKAKHVIQHQSTTAQAAHTAAWGRVQERVLALLPKRPRVFEAHHALTHARTLYLTEAAKGLPADLCEKRVLAAYS